MKKNNIISYITLLFALCSYSCASQTRIQKVHLNSSTGGSDCTFMSDTSIPKVTFIFEENFKDSLTIYKGNGRFLWKGYLETIHNLSVCEKEFEYDYNDQKEPCVLKFTYPNKKNVMIEITRKSRFVYVNIINGEWFFDGANCLRQYK